ncbi:MAG: glycosyltransferase, partial [Planctomycetales bacterium]|nr:glycosyltransferase [Planctomycetales bacterium]
IMNTERSREAIMSRYPHLPSSKFLLINNGYDPQDFLNDEGDCDQSSQNNSDSNGTMQIVHTGAFYGKRNVDALIQAIGELVSEGKLKRGEISLDLVGAARPGRNREIEIASSYGIEDMVVVSPPLSHSKCLGRLRDADVLLLVQTDAPQCIPGKVFEYIAVRKPIFTLAGSGATADLVAQEELGPCVDPQDITQVKEAVLKLVKSFQDGELTLEGRPTVETYNGRNQMNQFDEAFRHAMQAATNDPAARKRLP